MNALLQQLAREREARKAQECAGASDGVDAGTRSADSRSQGDSETGPVPGPEVPLPLGSTEGSRRSRKGIPKRRPQPGEKTLQPGGPTGGRHVLSTCNSAGRAGDLDLGSLFDVPDKAVSRPRKKPSPKSGAVGVEDAGKIPEAHRRPKKARREAGVLEGEFTGELGSAFDAVGLADVIARLEARYARHGPIFGA